MVRGQHVLCYAAGQFLVLGHHKRLRSGCAAIGIDHPYRITARNGRNRTGRLPGGPLVACIPRTRVQHHAVAVMAIAGAARDLCHWQRVYRQGGRFTGRRTVVPSVVRGTVVGSYDDPVLVAVAPNFHRGEV